MHEDVHSILIFRDSEPKRDSRITIRKSQISTMEEALLISFFLERALHTPRQQQQKLNNKHNNKYDKERTSIQKGQD